MTAITHILTDTVTYATQTGSFDSSGDPAYNAQATAVCRHEIGTFLVKDEEGVERQATDRVATETDIPANARIWLPGDDTSDANESRQIISRRKASNPSGSITLVEIFL